MDTMTHEPSTRSGGPRGTVTCALATLVRTTTMFALPIALVLGLHALGSVPAFRLDLAHPAVWLREAPPADAVLAVARLGALVAAYRALVPALLYLVFRLLDARPAAAAMRRAIPRVLRPAVERLAAVGGAAVIATSAAPALAMPAFPPPPLPASTSHDDGFVVSSPVGDETTEPSPNGPAMPRSTAPVPPSVPTSAPAGDEPASTTVLGEHVVRPGEHLWSIAAQEVARRSGRAVDELDAGDIAPYWRRVVAENRERLRSGDPDLIHPGERLTLPDDDT